MTGTERRQLVSAIEEITGEKSVYKFMPTCAYEIGDITVDKEGAVSCEDAEKLNQVIAALDEAGFHPASDEAPAAEQTEATEEPAEPAQDSIESEQEPAPTKSESEQEPETEETGLTISLPVSSASVGNLTNLLTAKGDLIRKAIGVDDIRIEVKDDKILFHWFKKVPEADEAKAYTDFVAAICKLSKDLKHVSATPHPVENEKYAFRCFLLRLGFIGPEYKAARKILLRNLTGSSAFRNGTPAKAETTAETEVAE
jgi:biotin carboxyl carrier protein